MSEPIISQAMLMAAGLGTRLRPFTETIPKVLLPVMGTPVAQYAVDALVTSGVKNIVANIHHLPEVAKKGLQNFESSSGFLQFSDESNRLLGSAGGIRKALDCFKNESFFLANGDVLCDIDWNALAACHFQLKKKWDVQMTLAVFKRGPSGENYREIHVDPEQGLVQKLGALEHKRPYFIGAAVLEKSAFAHLPSDEPADFVQSVLEPAIARQKVGAFLSSGFWFDLGSPLLWFRTHHALLHLLEVGRFATPMSRLWRHRIEKVNTRIGDRIWIAKDSPRPFRVTRWAPSCYWDGRGCDDSGVPDYLGPQAFLYGPADPERDNYSQGIGYGNLWHSEASQDLEGY
jgi:NDP-sugar pyrophosphorylase family protein